jgi:hypothetical protein
MADERIAGQIFLADSRHFSDVRRRGSICRVALICVDGALSIRFDSAINTPYTWIASKFVCANVSCGVAPRALRDANEGPESADRKSKVPGAGHASKDPSRYYGEGINEIEPASHKPTGLMNVADG